MTANNFLTHAIGEAVAKTQPTYRTRTLGYLLPADAYAVALRYAHNPADLSIADRDALCGIAAGLYAAEMEAETTDWTRAKMLELAVDETTDLRFA